jgi:hypothetical protein
MTKNLRQWLLTAILLLPVAPLSGQVTLQGGKGQLRVWDAEPVPPGSLYLSALYSFYAQKASVQILDQGQNAIKRGLLEDHTLRFNVTWGISSVFEFMLHTVPYQDNQRDLWGPIGDTMIGLKANIPRGEGILQWGLLAMVNLPTAPQHNLPFEPFSLDAPGWAMAGLVNVDLKNTRFQVPVKLSFNAGYRDLDWHDRFFIARPDQMIAGAGFKFPVRSLLLYSEVSGDVFINNTRAVQFEQNNLRLSQGVRFVAYNRFVIDIAADVRIGRKRPGSPVDNPYLKDYADWRILLGLSHRFNLYTHRTAQDRALLKRQTEEKEQLDDLRRQREKVGQELQDFRKSIKKEQIEKPPQ